MVNKNILISGAGIAGPALAYWLQKYGFQVTVIERAKKLRTDGFAIDVRGPGADVVKKMGLWKEIEEASTDIKELISVNKDGHRLGALKAGILRKKLGMDKFWVEVMRADLSKIMYDKTKDSTDYIFGDEIESLEEDDDGVNVIFKSGKKRRFDLVAGADGQRSNTRRLVFGEDKSFENYLGYYVAVITIENIEKLNHQALLYSEPNRSAYLYSARDPNKAMAFFMFKTPRKVDTGEHDVKHHREIILEAMSGMGWIVPQLLEKVRTAEEIYFDSVSQVKMPKWSKGRVVLLGDAAFAPSFLTGQGTQIAMTAAYILAGELKKSEGDYKAAFEEYETKMRPLINSVHKQVGHNGPLIIPGSEFGIWFRNNLVPLVIEFLIKTSFLWKKLYSMNPSKMISDY